MAARLSSWNAQCRQRPILTSHPVESNPISFLCVDPELLSVLLPSAVLLLPAPHTSIGTRSAPLDKVTYTAAPSAPETPSRFRIGAAHSVLLSPPNSA